MPNNAKLNGKGRGVIEEGNIYTSFFFFGQDIYTSLSFPIHCKYHGPELISDYLGIIIGGTKVGLDVTCMKIEEDDVSSHVSIILSRRNDDWAKNVTYWLINEVNSLYRLIYIRDQKHLTKYLRTKIKIPLYHMNPKHI